MAKAPEYRTSAAQWDGALPVVIGSGLLSDSTSAVGDQGTFVAPCDLEIVRIQGRILTANSDAAAAVSVGDQDSATGIVNGFSYTNLTGDFEIPVDDSTVQTTTITKGDAVDFSLAAVTAAGGKLALTLVCIPK